MRLNAAKVAALNLVPEGGIIAVDVHKTHLVLHLQNGRQIRLEHAADGQSIYWSEFYKSLKVQPVPFKDVKHTI